MTALCCCHLWYPSLCLGVCLCNCNLHLVITCVTHNCTYENPHAQLSGAMGWLFWSQPAQVGLELSQSSTAPWLLCQGESKAALTETGPTPCPETGQHERAGQGRLPGQVDVPVREGLDIEVVVWCVPARESCLAGVQAGLNFPGHV